MMRLSNTYIITKYCVKHYMTTLLNGNNSKLSLVFIYEYNARSL